MSAAKPMVITSLEVENVLRLKVVRITPNGQPLVLIRGENASGKTSLLEAIAMAFGGASVQPAEPVRRGESYAHVIVDLGDLVIERRWTEQNPKGHLVVRSADGAKFPKAQAKLDELLGRIAYDPMTFLRMDPKEQAKTVQKFCGVDLAAFDRKRAGLYETRTDKNRKVEILRGQLAGLGKPSGKERLDAGELSLKLAALTSRDEEVKKLPKKKVALVKEIDDLNRDWTERWAEVQAAQKALEAAIKRHTDTKAKIDTKRRDLSELDTAIAQAPILEPDIEDLREQLKGMEAHNADVARDEQRDQVAEQFKAAGKEADALTAAIEQVDKEKAEALAAVKLPIPGLSYTEHGVLLNDLPLEQASGAEQLRVAVAIGLAMNPTIRVLLCRDGSLLDEKSRAMVVEMVEAAGAQLWLEVVGKGDVGIVIEDGEVEAVDGVPAKKGGKRKSLEVVK